MLELFKTKKSVALICAVSLLLSSIIAAIPLTASADKNAESTPEIWGGKDGLDVTAVEYAGGDGTEDNPYLIENGDQLYKAAVEGESKYFRLENDIYLNDVSDESWYSGTDLNEWITDGKTFCGHFDGNGYVVHGIYYKDTATEMAALFPKLGPYDDVANVTVKNVGVEDSYIQGKYAGAITAVVDGDRDGNHTVNISCCYADESVYLKGTESNGFVAFLFNYHFTMDNCASRVRMIGTARTDEPIGSLLGNMFLLGEENGATNVDNAKKITIKDSYAVLQKEDRNAGFSAVPQSWTGRFVRYENVHAGVNPDGNGNSIAEGANFVLNNQTNCIFTHWPSDFRRITLPNSNFSSEIWLPGDGANRYMIQKVFNKGQIEESWNGGEAATEGDGSESNPYKIRTAKQLYWAINQGSSSQGKYYQLQNNIEITDTTAENWTENAINWVFPTGQYFAGNLDGNGYVVSGMYAEGEYPALIPTVNSDAGEITIKNIGIEASVAKGLSFYAGALIARTYGSNYINVSCCYAGEDVILSSSSKVGLVAEVCNGHFRMSNCFTLAQQSGGGAFAENQLYYGSLVGDVFGANDYFSTVSITNSYAVESPGYAAVCANWSGARCHFANIYTTTSISPNNASDGRFWNYVPELIKVVEKENMKDESAISTMANLDFNDIWMPVKNGYPKQQIFNKSSGGSSANFEGEGTKENPYRIKTAEEMNALRSLSSQQTRGKYYRLENDINFAGITCEMNISASFNGCFDGNGHTISNIVINEPGTGNTALFGKVGNNAVVENLRITNSSFTGKTAAAFIGTVAGENVMISKCFADSTVTVNGSNICGGIVGAISKNSFTMTSCAFTGKLIGGTAETPKAGLVGASTATNVKSTISSSYVATPDNDPAISPVSGTASLRFVGIYSTGVQIFGSADNINAKIDDLSLSQMTGDNAKTNMPMLDFDSVFVTKTDSTPVLRIFESDSVPVIKGTAGKVWSGKIATQYAGGTGAVNDPYLIATGEQLALLASTAVRAPLLTSGVFYKLTDDIILNDTQATEWYNGKNVNQWFYDYSYSSIGFLGHFDGAGHSVSGICNNEAGLCNGKVVLGSYGLFGALGSSAVVENVAVKNLYIKNGSGVNGTHAGSIAGFISPNSNKDVKIQIKKCVADATNVLSASTNGGILGHACIGVKIENCLSQAIPFAKHSNGTIVGVCDSPTATEITNCLVIEGLNDKTVAFWMTDAAWAASQAYPIVTNVYSTFPSTDVPAVGRSKLMGENAKKVLEGFDFDEVWTTVDNGTPTLRVFDGRYSQERKKVTISFYTDGGTEVKEVKGYPGEKIPWPDKSTIKRDADIFEGWYLEIQLLREYPIDVFPEYDIVLFAKWDVKTITQDFETYPYSDEGFEGLGLDYERYRPGSLGFDFKYVRDGLTSIHRKGTDSDVGESDFAILQDDMEPLEIGREYKLSFWVYVESVGNASDKIKLAHTDYLDVDEPIYYLEDICTLGSLKTGEWQEVTIKFTANAYYIALRTPGMSSMYFDLFKIVPSSSAINNIENSGISQTGEDITNILITITVMLASAALMIVFRPRRVKE